MQLTNYILDLGPTCHMTLEIYYFIPSLLVETVEYIEVAYGGFITEKKKEKFKLKCVTKMDNPSLLHYIMYYWNHTHAVNYFPLLC